jgi:hypothetical protein
MRRFGGVGRLVGALVALGLVASACSGSGGDDDDAGDDPAGGAADETTTTSEGAGPGDVGPPSAADLCADAVHDDSSPTLQEPDLTETSGVVTSVANPGVLWMHNDSGGDPVVWAIGADGADLGSYELNGADARDWEDIALGPLGPEGAGGSGGSDGQGGARLFLGDIGDNNSERSNVTIYRAPEPAVDPAAGGGAIDGVEAITATYADGARDAETLLADPLTGDLFILSKQWDNTPVGVYRIPAGTADGASVTMERESDAAVPAGELTTGGEISADGTVIAVRTYQSILLWDRAPDQTVAEALTAEPCKAAAVSEIQGESLALLPDGSGYVTVSEGEGPTVNYFRMP